MISISRKAFGSGYFGEWIEDEFGLPAYRYTCRQQSDPKASPSTERGLWRPIPEHLHQVGNDRFVGIASNFGHIRLRQDEGSPKFLNDWNPETHQYGGGFGYLTDGSNVLSTYYSENEHLFNRIFGIGYYRKTVKRDGLAVDQTVFAPYGDDPLLISQVTIVNERDESVDLKWIEYWGCQQYQFSFKALMRSVVSKKHPSHYRRRLSRRFKHDIQVVGDDRGVLDKFRFKGHPISDRVAWTIFNFGLRSGVGKKLTGGPVKHPVPEVVLEDVSPPSVFLVSLDSPFDEYGTDATSFFGEGGAISPDGLLKPLSREITKEAEVGFFLERKVSLQPKESRTIYFAYGYIPDGYDLNELIGKYQEDLANLLPNSSDKWKKRRIQLKIDDEDWVDRELTWHNYYLRSNLTYDSFFKEHILSQGHVYQYVVGFQGAARDPLQHALPFIFCEPYIVKDILRYTLKSVTPEGVIPYGITGSGMYLPSPFRPSDQELWLLWLASEYVLATRDRAFLDERVATYPVYGKKAGEANVRDLLVKCYRHAVETIGTGKHGLQRLSNGDWNDAMVLGYVSDVDQSLVEEVGESVLNASMASYGLDIFSRLMRYVGDSTLAEDALQRANAQKEAVREQWTGKWFRRAWLSDNLGWVGEDNLWLEPQPWAIIGGGATPEQAKALAQSIDANVRKPSKTGANIHGRPDAKMAGDDGIGANAGIWPSINGTLVWALALVDGKMAWDEWKKNTLAHHAENYPEIWYGIWSGPDTYNSEFSDFPGGTIHKGEEDSSRETREERDLERVGAATEIVWTDYPVMNMHPHAWPLQNIPKLLGVEFNEEGLDFAPSLPMDSYGFKSSLVEFERTESGYKGMYAPMTKGNWRITIHLGRKELERVSGLTVNGEDEEIIHEDDKLIFSGESSQDKPLTWKIRY
ncbi:MAG: GH36-type glycosyl hydrolase domain-containing protein [Candidatus Thorarchaeota archaeon]